MTLAMNAPENPLPTDAADALVRRLRAGDMDAAGELYQLLYDELRRIAAAYMAKQPQAHTLQTTALVNEALLRLMSVEEKSFSTREEFVIQAACAMRSVLVDYARRKRSLKRPPGGMRRSLDEVQKSYEDKSIDLIALDQALNELAEFDPRAVKVVELHSIVGLDLPAVARILGVGLRTAEHDWGIAKAWLRKRLT